MIKPVVLGFYGTSNTGKTTAIIDLITLLRLKGFTVATIKKTAHYIMLDTPGKDTYRHGQAGACPVVLSSSAETTIIINKPLTELQIINHLTSLSDVDIILIEGCSDDAIKKVKMDDDAETRKNTIFSYQMDKENIKNYVLDELGRRKKS